MQEAFCTAGRAFGACRRAHGQGRRCLPRCPGQGFGGRHDPGLARLLAQLMDLPEADRAAARRVLAGLLRLNGK